MRMGGWKYLPKTGVFQPKRENWNPWHFSEDDIVHARADLQSTALRLMMIMMTINGYLLNLEIDLVLEMFAATG